MAHILVIDDHPDIRALVQAALAEDTAYRVTCAATGDEALPLLDRDRPDVAVLDLVMPGMPGLECAAHLVTRAIPVILISGEPTMLALLKALAAPHLDKPFRLEHLQTEIRAAIAGAEANCRAVRAALDRFVASGEMPGTLAERLRAILDGV